MSSERLIGRSGMATMVGGLLWTALELTFTYEDFNKLKPISLLPLLAGLVGFYRRQQKRSGKLGGAGFMMAFLGLALLSIGEEARRWLQVPFDRLRASESCPGSQNLAN